MVQGPVSAIPGAKWPIPVTIVSVGRDLGTARRDFVVAEVGIAVQDLPSVVRDVRTPTAFRAMHVLLLRRQQMLLLMGALPWPSTAASSLPLPMLRIVST